jgi:hypothetical protein
VLALSSYRAILNNKLPAELKKYAIPAALQAGLPQSSLTALTGAITSGNSTLLAQVPGMDTAIEAAVGSGLATAYAAAYAYVYYAAVAVGGVGLIGESPCACAVAVEISLSPETERSTVGLCVCEANFP